VAGVAIEAAVRPGQRIARLRIVIKAPPRPTIWIVAECAIRSQTTLMMLVGVAGRAIQWRALKRQRAMAFFARYDGVASDQRESRNVVVEGGYTAPTRLVVTSLAAGTQLALVAIILPVTGYTGGGQFIAIEIAGVASIAFDFCMRGSQRKFRRLVMIEENRAPFVLVVAGLAFAAISSGMNILNPVAIDACGTDPLIAFANMARGADDGTMCASERKLGLVMVVRLDASPCRFAVTIIARFAEAPFVRIIRLVAVEAASGRIAKLYGLHMTAAALHGFVSIVQLEIRESVVEGFAIELDDVGISPLVISMAMGAVLLRRIQLPPVKSLTCEPIRRDFFMAC
jgi:hypothetical protein